MDEEQESVLDVDLGEGLPTEKRPWQEATKSGLLSGLRHGRRYGRLGLRYGGLGLRYGQRWGWPAVKWFAALSLPFFVLVRGSMYAYQSMGWGTWSSIGLGMFGTVVVFSAYAAWLWRRITGEGRWPRIVAPALIAVVAGYSIYGLLYLSSGNANDPDLGDYYMSLHPLMRLGASTYFLFDRNAVVTDLERRAEDYLAMGLPINEASLPLQARGPVCPRHRSPHHRPQREEERPDRGLLPDHGLPKPLPCRFGGSPPRFASGTWNVKGE